MPGPPKLQRVSGEEIRRRWSAMSLAQRKEVTRFDDVGLVNCIRNAVNSILARQIAVERAGERPSNMGAPDFFVDSALMKEVFDLPWNTYTSDEFPDAVLMDIDDQVPLMTVQSQILDSNQIFERLTSIMPDFLGATVKRTPIHRARWKKLWEHLPTTVPALEQQLVQLMEQAFWWFGSNPNFAVSAVIEDVQNTPKNSKDDDIPFEDWMTEPAQASTAQASSKAKKKRNKKKPAKPTEGPSRGIEDAEMCDDGNDEEVSTELDNHVTDLTLQEQRQATLFMDDETGSSVRSGPLGRRGVGSGVIAAEVVSNAVSTPSSSSMSRPSRHQFHSDSTTKPTKEEPRSVLLDNSAAYADENIDYAMPSVETQCGSGEQIDGTSRDLTKQSADDAADVCLNRRDAGVSEPEPEHVPCPEAEQPSRLRAPTIDTDIVETPVVHDHYWGQQEQTHRSRPSLQWCLPSGIWRRGRWARSRYGDPPASGTPIVCVQNTFINLDENVEPETGTRLTRSLSPVHCRGAED